MRKFEKVGENWSKLEKSTEGFLEIFKTIPELFMENKTRLVPGPLEP